MSPSRSSLGGLTSAARPSTLKVSLVFGSRISLKSLEMTCRSLATMLHSGVAINNAFQVAASRMRDGKCRRALLEVHDQILKGEDVTAAMRSLGSTFPPLMIDMIEVAEQTGALPEVLRSLAEHYENNLRLRKQFLFQIAWPVFQLTVAILVIAAVIFLLGFIADVMGTETIDPFGLGLSGLSGAILWLTMTFGSLLLLFIGYLMLTRALQAKQIVDPIVLGIPVIGNAMRSFAVARFSWAFYLTQSAGMEIGRSLDASFRATSNGAFIAAARQVKDMVRAGEDLSDALAAIELFPSDYLHMVRVAETSGTVPETLHRLSPEFEAQARRAMTVLAHALGWLVWLLVAMFIIFLVIRFVLWYSGMIQDLANPGV